MCGIAGSFGLKTDLTWLHSEIQRLSNRGPDSQCVVQVSRNLVLGASRLSMTDPHPRSNQPMNINNGKQWIVFNGEIYNYKKLRKLLLDRGISFETESDTEVLAKWLNEFGVLGVNELEGMFAFAYFDKIEKKLFLGRDSLGKKPLYWTISQGSLYWSSNSENLPSVSVMGKETLMSYFRLGYLVDPLAARVSVKAIKPGTILEFNEKIELGEIDLSRFPLLDVWDVTPKLSPDTLRKTIIESVEARVLGHDDVALSLSGGLDSSIIAIALASLGKKPHCFSAFWEDTDKAKYNKDAQIASHISKELGFRFSRVAMPNSSDIVQYLDLFLDAMQEPNNNPSGLSLYSLYSKVKESGARLILTGDGADEIFAGYERHKIIASAKINFPKSLNFFNGIPLRLPTERRRFSDYLLNGLTPPNNVEHWLFWHQLFSIKEISSLIGEEFDDDSQFMETLADSAIINPSDKAIRMFMQRDHQIWLSNESNRRLDRISMAHSIEARSPFQDENVIAYAHMASRQETKEFMNKRLLRLAFPEISQLGVRSDKFGFISPIGHWLRTNPNLVIDSLDFLKREYGFNGPELEKYEEIPTSGSFPKLMKLWSLVVLARWLGKSRVDLY